MNRLNLIASRIVEAEFDVDDDGYVTSADPILPPIKEVAFGGLASLIVFVLLWKYAWPSIKKAMQDRTARIQTDLDEAAEAKTSAQREAADIRAALGDIDAERSRLQAEADAQAEALLADGRARLDAEIADLEARADADIAAAAGRGSDELQADIARYASTAIDDVVGGAVDDATQQDLIEGFIARVGASA